MIADAHIHIKKLLEYDRKSLDFINENDYYALCSCSSADDYNETLKIAGQKNRTEKKLFISYGIHPFNTDLKELDFLESLAKEKKIDALGEIGLDRYTPELKENMDKQKKVFDLQLDIAVRYGFPVVLHVRKAVEELFSFSEKLSQIPAVIFHSYSGTHLEAQYILNKKINGFFSFGTPVINGNKKAVNALRNISLDRLLVETDAPYQPVKGEKYSAASDIIRVISSASAVKGAETSFFRSKVWDNFQKILTKEP